MSSKRPPLTATGDDPIDAILHKIEELEASLPPLFEALHARIDPLVPAMTELSKGIAEQKNLTLIKTLNRVGYLLSQIEQLPNIDAEQRGPIAREALLIITEALK